jgi:hypothetical protein
MAWAVVVLAAVLAHPAHASSGGRVGGSSLPLAKAELGSLFYDTFTTASCSQNGFSAAAVAHMTISGQVRVAGQTYLDGVQYDAFSEDLGLGPATFDTTFLRPRPTDPPFGAASATYALVFNAIVFNDGVPVGTVVTTITCTNGAFSAASQFTVGVPGVPAGHPASWAALALMLAAIAALRLSARRA